MRFSRDRRGQSVVVGTVILFGFLILALGIYQVQVVPTENADVEFEHSQEVEDGFGDLRNGVLEAASTGATRSTQIPLGTRYPSRTFFVNPPPVSGSLTTQETGEIRVRNATIGGDLHENVGLYWDTNPTYDTRSLQYDANYNEFQDAPRLTYEHSVVAAEFDDAILLRSGQTVLSEDREISLTALTGTVSENGIDRRTVDARAVSASDTTVPIVPDNATAGSITLELPTAVEDPAALATRWEERLPPGATAAADEANGTVRITLEDGSYRLGLSEVSLDTSGTTEPAYIVPVGSESVASGDRVRVEVRDRYNNPVPGATVSFSGTNLTNRTTGDDGRAAFTPNETGSLIAAINGTMGPTYESVPFTIREENEISNRNIFNVSWNGTAIGEEAGVEYFENEDLLRINSNAPDPISGTGTVTASNRPLDGATVDFATTNSTVSSFDDNVSESTDGVFETGIIPGDTGNTTLFAASGDDVDGIDVEVLEQLPRELYPDSVTENAGTISNFVNMQNDDGEVATMDGQGNTAFDITTQTENVDPDTYDLELGVSDVNLQGGSGGITVTVRDEDGTELGTTTLTNADSGTTVLVSLDSVEGPNPQQISVQYSGDRQNDDLDLEFQRLVTFE